MTVGACGNLTREFRSPLAEECEPVVMNDISEAFAENISLSGGDSSLRCIIDF
ncbi:hypothetical protein [Streptomyces sp. NPDC088725]|uniref:hypothetical protein n=1 Tax=Streptomyces sp. NPDC088725 TaxID=3365873 RepID=UPI003802E1E3